ncbi:helix-turn-helix domain-containing protein [Yaniella sp.]|uniref:helix-turn-helix domain-containing protein n=1 Tax=Yaniella sp. TaxID=2773929 RepID=UPI002649F7B0|nr:helix-turn-helix domain-containing protein [Yaniella sp.]MDN5815647.1 helix-turn-helix domain-containing protein [Yaniella sp.]
MLPLSSSPTGRKGPGDLLAEPVLYWVARGRSVIEVDGHGHPVHAGTALWVAGGRRIRVLLGRSDVLVPLPGIGRGESVRTATFAIPTSWHPWLLHAFGKALGYLDGGSSRALLEQMLAAASTRDPGPSAPPHPVSADLVALAESIVSDSSASVAELARTHLVGWTPRTLQRRFASETGLTPEKWARQQRMAQAADLLAEGNDILAVAHAVGYATASGFSRSFREQTGMSPGRWRSRTISRASVGHPADAPSAAELPAQRTWPRVNGSHVAVWALQGRSVLTIGGRNLRLDPGSTAVIPAGLPNSIRIPQGSLVLPLGFRLGRDGGIGAPVSAGTTLPGEQIDLIQAAVMAYTTMRPHDIGRTTGFDIAYSRGVYDAATLEDDAIATLASGLASGEITDTALGGCAHWLGMQERDLSRTIRDRTGLTFTQWIRLARMSRARAKLHGGEPASAISRLLGYAHLPAFSRAFREVHGASPQRLVSPLDSGGEVGRWQRDVSDRIRRWRAETPRAG